ncbi:MAG: hypothetical protein ACTSYI_16290 [Promethearchaeota archaeon]
MSKLKDLWTTTSWFKIFALFIVLGSIAGAILQYGVGVSANAGGTVIMEELEPIVLPYDATNETIIVYTGSFTEPNGAIAFATNVSVDFYIFDFAISESVNSTELIALGNLSRHMDVYVQEFSIWTNFESEFSLVIITPPEQPTLFAMSVREYSDVERAKINYYGWGAFLLDAVIWGIGIFVVVFYLVPAFKNRFNSSPIPPSNSTTGLSKLTKDK